jgi:hypothetical protein
MEETWRGMVGGSWGIRGLAIVLGQVVYARDGRYNALRCTIGRATLNQILKLYRLHYFRRSATCSC